VKQLTETLTLVLRSGVTDLKLIRKLHQ